MTSTRDWMSRPPGGSTGSSLYGYSGRRGGIHSQFVHTGVLSSPYDPHTRTSALRLWPGSGRRLAPLDSLAHPEVGVVATALHGLSGNPDHGFRDRGFRRPPIWASMLSAVTPAAQMETRSPAS